MTNKSTRKVKKPLETTLGRAPSHQSQEIDFSHLRQPIETSIYGIREVLQVIQSATDEVKNYIMYECDIMYECRTCRTIFRSLANFILHKRNYCKDKFNSVDYMNNNTNQEYIQTIVTQANLSNSPENRSESVKKTLSPIIEKLIEKQKVVQLAHNALHEDLSKISGNNYNKEISEKKSSGDIKVVLENIATNNAAVFQTMIKNPTADNEDELMKNEVMEIHGILDSDGAVLGPDGKVSIYETNKSRRNIPAYVQNKLYCTECKLSFVTKKTLEYHIRTKHNNTRIIYHCPTCKLPLATPWSVCRHLLKVHKMSNKQVRRMREQIHNSQVRKDQEPAVKKKANEAERLQENTDEENQWLNNFEGDNDLQMCGGCGKRFERKAALFSHSQMCAKRIAVCNAIKGNTTKKKGEEVTEKPKPAKTDKPIPQSCPVLTGSQKRKPQICKTYKRKSEEVIVQTTDITKSADVDSDKMTTVIEGNTKVADLDSDKITSAIETVYILSSKGSDSPSSFKSDNQSDPLEFKDTNNQSTSEETAKENFKNAIINNDIDFEAFCEKGALSITKPMKKNINSTKSTVERCHKRLRSRDVIVEDDEVIFVSEEILEPSTKLQPTVIKCEPGENDIVPKNKNNINKTYQISDDGSDFAGFSSEEQNIVKNRNGLCHLGVELDQDLSTLSYNNPLKRKRESITKQKAIEESKVSNEVVADSHKSVAEDKSPTIKPKLEFEVLNDTPKSVPEYENSVSKTKSELEKSKQHKDATVCNEDESHKSKTTCSIESLLLMDTTTSNENLACKDEEDDDLEIIFSSFENVKPIKYEKPALRRKRGVSLDYRSSTDSDKVRSQKWGESFLSRATQYMDQENLMCIPCKLSYKSFSMLLWHMSAHFSWFRFQCSKCSFVSFCKFDCVKHSREAHNLQYGSNNSIVDIFLPIPHWKTVLMAHDFQPQIDGDGLCGKHTDEIIVEHNVNEDLKTKAKSSDINENSDNEELLFSDLLGDSTDCSINLIPSPKQNCAIETIDIEDNNSNSQKIDSPQENDFLCLNVSDIIKRTINDDKYRDCLNVNDQEDTSSRNSSCGGDDVSDREFYNYEEEYIEDHDKNDLSKSHLKYNMVVEMVDYSNDKSEPDQLLERYLNDQKLNEIRNFDHIEIDEQSNEYVEEGNQNDVLSEVESMDVLNTKISSNDCYEDVNDIEDVSNDMEVDTINKAIFQSIPECVEENVRVESKMDDGCERVVLLKNVCNTNINNSDNDSDVEEIDVVPKSIPSRMRPTRNRIKTLQKDFYYDLKQAVKLNDTVAVPPNKRSKSRQGSSVIQNKVKESGGYRSLSADVCKTEHSHARILPVKKK